MLYPGITEGITPNMNLLGDECVFERAIQKKLVLKKGILWYESEQGMHRYGEAIIVSETFI